MTKADMRPGIDLDGTRIEGVVINENGNVVQCHRIPTPQKDYWSIPNSIAGLVTHLTTDLDLPVGIRTLVLSQARPASCATAIVPA